jgi:hypothetical protein
MKPAASGQMNENREKSSKVRSPGDFKGQRECGLLLLHFLLWFLLTSLHQQNQGSFFSDLSNSFALRFERASFEQR